MRTALLALLLMSCSRLSSAQDISCFEKYGPPITSIKNCAVMASFAGSYCARSGLKKCSASDTRTCSFPKNWQCEACSAGHQLVGTSRRATSLAGKNLPPSTGYSGASKTNNGGRLVFKSGDTLSEYQSCSMWEWAGMFDLHEVAAANPPEMKLKLYRDHYYSIRLKGSDKMYWYDYAYDSCNVLILPSTQNAKPEAEWLFANSTYMHVERDGPVDGPATGNIHIMPGKVYHLETLVTRKDYNDEITNSKFTISGIVADDKYCGDGDVVSTKQCANYIIFSQCHLPKMSFYFESDWNLWTGCTHPSVLEFQGNAIYPYAEEPTYNDVCNDGYSVATSLTAVATAVAAAVAFLL